MREGVAALVGYRGGCANGAASLKLSRKLALAAELKPTAPGVRCAARVALHAGRMAAHVHHLSLEHGPALARGEADSVALDRPTPQPREGDCEGGGTRRPAT